MKLLIARICDISHETLQKILGLGHSATFVEDERILLQEQGLNPADFEGVICNSLFLYNDIADFSSLRYIQLISAGYDRVPLDKIESRGIEIHNARGVYDIPMAEWALCGILQLYKKSACFHQSKKDRLWKKERDILELSGKTVCIVGCGSVGGACARLFRAVGCEVIGVNRSQIDDCDYTQVYALKDMNQAFAQSDVVIVTLPAVSDTYRLISAEHIQACKHGVVIVNLGRGSVVDTDALILGLESGKLQGAVIDVFESEPLPPDHPLWTFENVVLTPHNSFIGEGNAQRLATLIIENLKKNGYKRNASEE